MLVLGCSIRKTKQLDVDKMLRQREERMSSVTLKSKAIWLDRDAEGELFLQMVRTN